MFCDIFQKSEALKLLSGKIVWFMGSSNMRAIYKDLLWLLNKGNLAPQEMFKCKNEPSYLTDVRVSNGKIHNGVNYVETRESKGEVNLFFHFLTRVYSEALEKMIEKTVEKDFPDVIFINSTIWDLSRYGETEDCIVKFKENLVKTFKLLTTIFPNARIIWKTCLPIDRTASGAIFVDEIKDVVPMVPWHIIEANRYAAVTANFFNIDVLDFHHHIRLAGYHRVKDGIHWNSLAVRYLCNVFLTHLSLCFSTTLPGVFKPNDTYLSETSSLKLEKKDIEERLDKKKDFISKLLTKAKETVKAIKKTNPIKKAKHFIKKNKNIRKYKVQETIRNNNRGMEGRNNYSYLPDNRNVNYNCQWNRPPLNYNAPYYKNFSNPYTTQFSFGNNLNHNMYQNTYGLALNDAQIQMVCANLRSMF